MRASTDDCERKIILIIIRSEHCVLGVVQINKCKASLHHQTISHHLTNPSPIHFIIISTTKIKVKVVLMPQSTAVYHSGCEGNYVQCWTECTGKTLIRTKQTKICFLQTWILSVSAALLGKPRNRERNQTGVPICKPSPGLIQVMRVIP